MSDDYARITSGLPDGALGDPLAEYRRRIASLPDATWQIDAQYPADLHTHTRPRPWWLRLAQTNSGSIAAIATGAVLLAGILLLPADPMAILISGLTGVGTGTLCLANARLARAGIARVSRRYDVKRSTDACTVDTPCSICAEVKQWDGPSWDGSTTTPDGPRWL
jgi:hypothetical protein